MTMRSALGKVRGLGSAKSGTGHWWSQRVTAVALLPLTLWFVFALANHSSASHGEIVAWIGQPFNAVLLISVVAVSFYHAYLGLQVVIEDYVQGEAAKLTLLLLVKGASLLLAMTGILSVLTILFRG